MEDFGNASHRLHMFVVGRNVLNQHQGIANKSLGSILQKKKKGQTKRKIIRTSEQLIGEGKEGRRRREKRVGERQTEANRTERGGDRQTDGQKKREIQTDRETEIGIAFNKSANHHTAVPLDW